MNGVDVKAVRKQRKGTVPSFARAVPAVLPAKTFRGPVGAYVEVVSGKRVCRMRFEVEKALYIISQRKLHPTIPVSPSSTAPATTMILPLHQKILHTRFANHVLALNPRLVGTSIPPASFVRSRPKRLSRLEKCPPSGLREEIGKDEEQGLLVEGFRRDRSMDSVTLVGVDDEDEDDELEVGGVGVGKVAGTEEDGLIEFVARVTVVV
ncbi:hypothetical protein HDU97_009425 [Phlyctochytrium planicorne]|nr:hypothetical protein HDU97_009425 [Phlyctochytrium planicorne]